MLLLQGAMTFAFRASQISVIANYERTFDFDNGCGSNAIFPDAYTTKGGTWQVYSQGSTTMPANHFELGVSHTSVFQSNGNVYRWWPSNRMRDGH